MSQNPVQQHLLWALRYGFDRGKGHEAQSLLDVTEDLTPEQANWKPAGTAHTIWETLNHVAHWKETVTRTLDGESVSFEGKWPAPTAITEAEWQRDIQNLKDFQGRLIKHLEAKTDDELHAPLPDLDDWNLAKVYTGLVAHDSYHCGQIVKLRQLQDISG